MDGTTGHRGSVGVDPSRGSGAVVLAAAGAVLLLTSLIVPAVAGAEPGGKGGKAIVSIEQKALPSGGDCNPFAQAQMTYNTASSADHFRLVVTSATAPCTPIAAAAVAYRMPANGQWPQTLVERRDFTISGASVTTITFAKECTALQFDVITGESPKVIAPEGPWHGPLLFPGDTSTSQQYMPPEKCNEVATSSTTTTASTAVPAPTVSPATSTPTVAGQTTIAPAPAPNVADTTATNPNAAKLAMTGRNSAPVALIGALLLVLGVVLHLWSRRSRQGD